MPVDTKELRISRLSDQDKNDDLSVTTPAQRIQMMWQLALDAWAFKGESVAEQSFQKKVVRVIRLEEQ